MIAVYVILAIVAWFVFGFLVACFAAAMDTSHYSDKDVGYTTGWALACSFVWPVSLVYGLISAGRRTGASGVVGHVLRWPARVLTRLEKWGVD